MKAQPADQPGSIILAKEPVLQVYLTLMQDKVGGFPVPRGPTNAKLKAYAFEIVWLGKLFDHEAIKLEILQ